MGGMEKQMMLLGSDPKPLIRAICSGLQPEVFAPITTYENSRYCKPNPDYYREILDKLGLLPEDCIMVGNGVAEAPRQFPGAAKLHSEFMTMFLLIPVLLIAAVFLGGAYYAYRVAFYSPRKDRGKSTPIVGEGYDPYREEMRQIHRRLCDRPCEYVTVVSHDGLTLSGRYYHIKDGAPLDIGFHGYRSSCIRDFSGGSALSFQLEHNLLLVDQRAHGNSEGRTIAFGIQERQDLLAWVSYALERFGPETKILLYGISMGGATVLMASELDLPENVKGIIADCPYSSPLEIILHVGKKMPFPSWLIRPFAILGAKIFGGFDLTETTAADAVSHAKIPILIIHGDADSFVPSHMSDLMHRNPKMVTRYTFPGADHGISYLVDTDRYSRIVAEFIEKVLK